MSIEGRASYDKSAVLRGRLVGIPQIDITLSKEGYCADAKATGDKLERLNARMNNVDPTMASGITYDNTTSGFEATSVQGAIDELINDTLRKSGGMVQGTLMVQNADNGYGSLMKNNSASADYGTQVSDVTSDGKTARVTVNATSNLLSFVDTDSNIRNIYHDGNKRFGNYEGNGSATQMTINTESVGRLLLVYNTSYFSFVTPSGAYVRNLTDGTDRWIESQEVFYINGVLTLATTNAAFNESGTTYYYQAL